MSHQFSEKNRSSRSFEKDSELNIRANPDAFLNKSNEDIWIEFKSGNEEAFIYIYDNYFDGLVKYGLNFCADKELVLDCLQDMFIELREKRKSITKTDQIKPLLFKIFRRRLNHYLKKIKRESLFKDISSEIAFDITISHEHALIEKQLTKDQVSILNEAMNKLSTKEREVLYQYYYESMSYGQIAEVMGYTQVKTARTLVYRALKSIRGALTPQQKHLFYLFF